MSTEEWLAKVAADRPPLSDAQIAALRPVLAPIAQYIATAPAAEAGAAAETAETEPERNTA
jgi:hypothetical protein